MENSIDLTYDGKLKIQVNILEEKEVDVLYTICGDTGDTTTTSFKLNDEPLLMITFNYQDLKNIVDNCEEIKK